ncbi:hypothetical protein LJ739_06715 [Aestuariibacter halophilus]|uniref:Uncharacterized protein n=1 Tax=Fluctibacter halophilus TaxID=226011 RepID=A0ABS8G602_9ALTE|nr:hypothetical protein [Aestuariibacter halophilus]MCC2615928.1 hypothetical protein [Aestuariibacter halophilus]
MPVIDLGIDKPEQKTPNGNRRVIDLDSGGFKESEYQRPTDEQRQVALEAINDNLGVFDSLAIATGRGLMDVVRGATFGLLDPEDETVKQAFSDLEKKRPVTQTVGRFVGQAAPFMVPGAAIGKIGSTAGRVAASTGLGATEGAIISEGMGTGDTQDAAILGGTVAGALELVFPQLSRLGRRLVTSFKGTRSPVPVVNKLGEPSKDLLEALDDAGLTFDDLVSQAEQAAKGSPTNAQQKARRALFNQYGIEPTRAQMTGSATDFQVQQELVKKDGIVRKAIQEQDDALMSKVDDAVGMTGKPSSSTPYNPVTHFVEQNAIAQDGVIGAAYSAARDLAGDNPIVELNALRGAVDSLAGTDRVTGGLRGAVRSILRDHGVSLKGKKSKPISPNTAERIRQDLNSYYDSLSSVGKRKLAQLKEAIDDDVFSATGVDEFEQARAMKRDFEKSLTRIKSSKFDQRSKEFVRDILGNKYNPDTFFNDAVLAKATRSTDLEQLKRYLLNQESPEAIEAWASVRADALEYIRDQSFKDVSGKFALSEKQLTKALNRLGRDKLRVLFDKEEREFLKGLQAIAKIREPARGTQLGLGPSAQAIQSLNKSITKNSMVYDFFKGLKVSNTEKNAITIPQPIKPLDTGRLASDATRVLPGAAAAGVSQDKENN